MNSVWRPRRSNSHLPNLPNFNLGPLPLPPVDAGPDRLIPCAGDSVELGTPPQPGLLYSWSPIEGLSDPNVAQPQAAPQVRTDYVLTLIDTSRDCRNTAQDTVRVSLEPPPSPLVVEAGPDTAICPGQAIRLGSPARPGWRYRWSPAAGLDDPSTAQPWVRPRHSTSYTLQVEDPSQGCLRSGRAEVYITVRSPQLAEAGPEQLLCEGREMREQLGSPAMGEIAGAVYHWSPAEGLDDTQSPRPWASPQQPTLYHLTLIKDSFCISRDSVWVRVEPCTTVYAPTAFSPNGDGINEYFAFGNLPAGSSLHIRNRWGRVVYHSDGYDNRWQAHGQPEGGYAWVLRLPDGEVMTGSGAGHTVKTIT